MVRIVPIATIVFLFSLWQTRQVDGNPVMMAIKAGKIAYQVYGAVKKIIKKLEPGPTADEQLSQEAIMVFDKLDGISDKVTHFQNELFRKLSKDLYSKFLAKTDNFYKTIRYINSMYDLLHEYTKNMTYIPEQLLDYYQNSVLGKDTTHVTNQIEDLHYTLTAPDGENESLLAFLTFRQDHELMCLRHQSLQQVIWELYHAAVSTDLKALAMVLVSLQGLKNTTEKAIDYASQLELSRFNKRVEKTYDEVVKHMALASRDLWKCDPPSFTKEKSYSKLQEIFQGIITNEMDTTGNTCSWGGCYELNIQSERVTYQVHTTFSKLQPEKLRCNGQLAQCKQTAKHIDFCVAPSKDDRRYLGMMTTVKYGDYSPDCEKRDKANQVMGGLNECQFCLCTCATTNLEADRYFSLKPSKSNIVAGMVVTGVRLKKVNHVFYIEIQEGRLRENGTIEENSTQWKEIPKDKKVNFNNIVRKIPPRHFNDFLTNKEVFTVHWHQKTVLLDDILSESSKRDKVLTGLQFMQQNDTLMLRIRLSPIDYRNGKIIGDGKWHHSELTTTKGRKRISLMEADDPVKHWGHVANVDPHPHKYFQFQVTNLKKNMGQFTVPFLDMQEIVTSPPTPIVGAGLFHKGVRSGESGGFLGLKLIQYDFSKHLL